MLAASAARPNDSPRAGVRGRRTRRTADDELGDERRRLVQPPLLAADGDRSRATSRSSKASGARTCAARVSARSTRAKRSRSSIDGVIYVVDGRERRVRGQRRRRGEILWEYRANLDPANNAVCCGWTSRGVGLGDGKVFVGQLDGKLVALDQRTRQASSWSVQAERWQEGYSITSAPLYFDGLVYTGFAGGERGIRGRVKAFEREGRQARLDVLHDPGPGEVGHDTWPQDNEIWMDGGAPVWNTPAVDPELGLIYFATGNPGPRLQRLDPHAATTCSRRRSSPSTRRPASTAGTSRRCITTSGTTTRPRRSTLFDIELERRHAQRHRRTRARPAGSTSSIAPTAQPLVGIDERPVLAGAAARHGADAAVPARRRVRSAVDRHRARGHDARQRRQDLHAVLDDAGADEARPARRRELAAELVRRAERLPVRVRGRSHLVVSRRRRSPRSARRRRGLHRGRHRRLPPARRSACSRPSTCARTSSSGSSTGPSPCYSGSLATAGGLVFVGRSDGRLTALDSSDGKKLWEFQTGAGMNSPATSFEHNGKQYVRRLLRRQSVRGLGARRQPLAVRLGRHARAGAAGGRR